MSNYRKCPTNKIDYIIFSEAEQEAMISPTLWRCKRCGNEFGIGEGNVLRFKSIGYFFCFICIGKLHPEGCLLEAYKDINRFDYICDNCPIHPLECDLREIFFVISVESDI